MFEEFNSAGEDSTSKLRLRHWRFGIDATLDHPVLGIGYENWISYCNFMNPYGLGVRKGCQIAHNTYISAATEIGLTGLVFFT